MTASTLRILGLNGSLREASLNGRLLTAAARRLPTSATFETVSLVGELPLFDQDLEAGALPAAVLRFQEAVRTADALIIASPEYNGSLTGVLKNALDWASRPGGNAALAGVPVAVVGASPSRFGAAWAQADTRRVVDRIGGKVVPLDLAVAEAGQAFDADGDLRDPDLRLRLNAIVEALVDLATGTTDLDTLAHRPDAVEVGTPPGVAA